MSEVIAFPNTQRTVADILADAEGLSECILIGSDAEGYFHISFTGDDIGRVNLLLDQAKIECLELAGVL